MSRKIIDRRTREIIINVDDYFAKEKEDTKVLLQHVARALQNAVLDNSDDVILSKQIAIEMLKHLQDKTKVTERVLSVTGVAKNTVTKLRREKKIAAATGSKIKSPIRKKRGKKVFLDSFSLSTLRNIINSMYTIEMPTMPKILAAAKRDLNYKGSETTLRTILKTKLGYQFKKCNQNRLVLIEKPNIQAWRARYLRRMKENDLLGANKQTVIYIGETSIRGFSSNTDKQCQSATDVGVSKNNNSCWIIIHAGSESGFVNGALLMFKAEIKSGDHRDQINPEKFTKWLEQQLLPHIPANCIIVMDNAPYHDKEEDRPPNMASNTQAMVEWLRTRNVEFPEQSTKAELYLLIKNHREPKRYKIDKLLSDHGHEVVRLPPYNCDLNPIVYIWYRIKQLVSDKDIESESKIESSISEALQSITSEDWKKEVTHVKQLEQQYWHNDRLVDEICIITANDSDMETAESENDSEFDLEDVNNMSGVEEIV